MIEPMKSTRPARFDRFCTSRITSPANVTVRTPGFPLNWLPSSSTTSGSGSVGTTRKYGGTPSAVKISSTSGVSSKNSLNSS